MTAGEMLTLCGVVFAAGGLSMQLRNLGARVGDLSKRLRQVELSIAAVLPGRLTADQDVDR